MAMIEKTYLFGKSQLTIKFGDITTATTEVLVSSDDYFITMGGGVSRSILKAGGANIKYDAQKQVPTKMGDVIVTSAGALSAKFVFHGITIGPEVIEDKHTFNIIESIINRCFDLMGLLHVTSIAFPALGTGVARFSMDDVAIQMSETIVKRLLHTSQSMHVYLYLMDRSGRKSSIDYLPFFEQFACRMYQLGHDMHEISHGESHEITTKEKQLDEIRQDRIHHLRKLLNMLEHQRSNLENQYMDSIGIADDDVIKKIKHQLEENNNLRLPCLKELHKLENGNYEELPSSAQLHSVFISSTYEDLQEERNAISKIINQCKMLPVSMELWGANDKRPTTVIIDELRKSDIYLGIFGNRYGYIDDVSGMSMTELEYREALSQHKPILIYILKDAEIQEEDNNKLEKFQSLLKELQKNHTVYLYSDTPQLEKQVLADLLRIKDRKE